MARGKGGPSLDDMRAGLAAMAAAGDWTPTKPIAEYKAGTIARKFGDFTRSLAAGERPSNQHARGHGKTEHGKASGYAKERAAHPLAPAPREPAPPGRRGAGGGQSLGPGGAGLGGGRDIGGGVKIHDRGVTSLPGGRVVIEGHTKREARFALGVAEGLGEHKRVQVVGMDKDGKQHVIGRKGGLSPAWVREQLAQHRGGMGGGMAAIAAAAGDYGGGEIEWSGDFDIVIL